MTTNELNQTPIDVAYSSHYFNTVFNEETKAEAKEEAAKEETQQTAPEAEAKEEAAKPQLNAWEKIESSIFNKDFYSSNHAALRSVIKVKFEGNNFKYFKDRGCNLGHSPDGKFDSQKYLESNKDVAELIPSKYTCALEHCINEGVSANLAGCAEIYSDITNN
jgi:hypothetical protein